MQNKTLSFAAAAVAAVLTTAMVAGFTYAYQGDWRSENFTKFAEMHQAMQDGDTDRAQALHDEFGLPDMKMKFMRGKHIGFGHGMMGFGGRNADIKAAIDAGDYEAFKAAVEQQSPLRYITADNFAEFAAAVKAAENDKAFTQLKAFHDQYGPQVEQ